MNLIDDMFGPDVATCVSGLVHDFSSLMTAERKPVERAVARRKVEFASGRHCAREAMKKLGLSAAPVLMGSDRAPQWPQGVVGSISHCRTRCIAAVARKSDHFAAIGVDIEEAVGIEENLHASICTPDELQKLQFLPPQQRALTATEIFSAKETIFKCQYPLTGCMLDFQDVEVEMSSQVFRGRVRIDHPELQARTIVGQIRQGNGYIVTGMVFRSN